jgi:hypothetical protein
MAVSSHLPFSVRFSEIGRSARELVATMTSRSMRASLTHSVGCFWAARARRDGASWHFDSMALSLVARELYKER